MRVPLSLAGLALALAVAAPPAGAATRAVAPVPLGFVGMNVDGDTVNSNALDSEMGLMTSAGVESVRGAFFWFQAQPYATAADVPVGERGRFVDVGGVPTDFTASDRPVEAAARRGLRVLPAVLGTPDWDRQFPARPFSPPARTAPYAAFLRALIGRYGPRGSFWSAHPGLRRVPIRAWQVWNEESGANFWEDDDRGNVPAVRHRWVRPYLQLLRAAHGAIKAADPGASVVLGGLFSASWISMRQLYAADPRAGRFFDVAAVHPYTALPANVLRTIEYNRTVMDRRGDRRKPITLTEFGWPSAAGHANPPLGFETTEAGQARLLRQGLNMVARARARLRIVSVYWFDWAGTDGGTSVFSYAGVRHRSGDGRLSSKPAFGALRSTARALEGCARHVRRPGCGS